MGSAEIEARLSRCLATAPAEVVCAYLFGSMARGTGRIGSDLDLGILLTGPAMPTLEGRLVGYEAALEHSIGRRVQLVILNDAPVDLVHRVLRDGRILLDRDRSARIRFEVHARNQYFDLLPFLQRYRTAAIAKALEATR